MLTAEQKRLIEAAYHDARKTWPDISIEYLETQAERVLKGERPQGAPGMSLARAFKAAGFIARMPR